MIKPIFTHDCDTCKFLGHVLTVNGNADVYYSCDSRENYRNLIFRYSDEPADYSHVGTERTKYLFDFEFCL